MIYERDFMKHTILEHDAVFKNQVHELHRLYRVQRNLVDQVKEKNSIEDMNLSNHTSDNASKRQLPVYGEGSSSQACNGRFQNGRRMIDLELPADEFLDMDETGDTDEITTCLPYKRPRSGREGGSHQSGNSSGSCLDVKNSNGLADLNEPLNWQDSEPVARDMYSHYGRNNVYVQGQRLEKNRVLGAGHDRRTQRDLHLPSHSVQVGYNSAVQPQSYLTTDHSNVIFSRERANHRELEVRSKNPQASYDSYMASNAARLHNDYRPDFVRPWSHWSSSWENPRSSSHQRSYPVQTNPYMNFVSHARPDSSFEMRNAISNGIYHGFSSGSKEATSNFPSGGFRPNVYSGEVVKHKSSEKLQGPRKQESSGGFPWLKPKPSYKSERSNGFFDLNASTDQFMDGTDTWDSRNGVPPQKGLRSSASCSNNANMGRIEMNNPQSSRKFEKLTVCKEEHTPLVFHSADQHKEVNHLVKRDFDINLPCDASVSVDQRGSKAFEKEDGNKAAHKRHYIDLNSCASENDEDSGMPSRLRVKSKGNFWIDLEAPPALESEEEEREGSQEKPKEETWGFMKDQDDNSLDELIKEAAQAIVAISLSDHQRHPDDAASSSTDAASKSPLSLFADIITSGELEKKVDGSPEATNLESYREEYSSGEIDYFEAMTLNLHPTKEEDYMPEPLVPKNLILEGTGLTKLRRGQARRGRPKRDFQRDTLPGLSSLSRQEVTEDMQLFGGLMKSREQTWSSGVAARRNSKRKRTVTNISQDQVGPQPENVSVVGLEESKLTGWGKATRRPRRQRCPPAGNPSTVVFT